jgi:hypothetical protein
MCAAVAEELRTHSGIRATIPEAAIVEVNVPPSFVALELCEHAYLDSDDVGNVQAAWVSGDGDYFFLAFRFAHDAELPDVNVAASARMTDADTASWAALLTPLTAAVIRDFWVVEEREQVLGLPTSRRIVGLRGTGRRVVYLPRMRYVGGPEVITRVEGRMAYQQRAAYFRRDHFRKLAAGQSPSPMQLALERAHHRSPTEGYTWVRRTEIAGSETERVCRSRSLALALFDAVPGNRSRPLDTMSWFDFERRCETWVRDQGWTVVRKVGDNGIDVLALRTTPEGEPEEVIVQAKHWRALVGPDVVRELAGARQQRGAGIAILVVSSGFTRGPSKLPPP